MTLNGFLLDTRKSIFAWLFILPNPPPTTTTITTTKNNAILATSKCLVTVILRSSHIRLQYCGDIGQSVSLNQCLLCLVMLSLCRDLQAAISVRREIRRKQTRWNLLHSFDSTTSRVRFTLSNTWSKSALLFFPEGAQIKLNVCSLVSHLVVPSENNRSTCIG